MAGSRGLTMIQASVEGGLGRLVLSQPPLNILTRELLARLRDELRRLAAAPSLRVLVLSGEGKHFSVGADVREHLPPEYHTLIPEFLATVAAIDAFPLPVIAAVQGRCLGGAFELVLAGDVIIAADDAFLGQPEIALGVVPPAACTLLPRRCSPGAAAALLFTGDALCARDAEQAGIVWRVVPVDQLDGAALELGHRITRHSAAALRTAKRMLREARDRPLAEGLARAGRMYTDELMETVDAMEGLRAFLDKRTPVWSHR